MKFSNKTAVFTGAVGGVGTAITQLFLDEGVKVAAVDLSTEALEKLHLVVASRYDHIIRASASFLKFSVLCLYSAKTSYGKKIKLTLL